MKKVVLLLLTLAGIGLGYTSFQELKKRLKRLKLVIDISSELEKEFPQLASAVKSTKILPKNFPVEPLVRAFIEKNKDKRNKYLEAVKKYTKYIEFKIVD